MSKTKLPTQRNRMHTNQTRPLFPRPPHLIWLTDSIESDHEDESSIDLSHSPKRTSPIDHQHLDPHNPIHLNQQQANTVEQQQLAAAAAAFRQQLGAAINLAGNQNLLGQLASQLPPVTNGATPSLINLQNQASLATNPTNSISNNHNSSNTNNNGSAGPTNPIDLIKQQQEQQQQIIAALLAAASQQQQPQSQPQQTSVGQEQQATSRSGLSTVASNAMLIAASNAPEAMAVATAAQAMGVKGAFIILLL